jgi:hypothetical protein
VNARRFWKALAVQAVVVIALFAVLGALPLPDDLFERWGVITGPLAWLGCALVTGRLLRLPQRLVLLAALAGGAVGAIVFLLGSHAAGMAAALLVFAACCGAGLTPRPDHRRVFNR